MSAESYDSSAGSDRDERIASSGIDPMNSADIETSVLDALRPLLRQKRKKADDMRADEVDGAGDALAAPDEADVANDDRPSETGTNETSTNGTRDEFAPAAAAVATFPADRDQERTTDMTQAATAAARDDTKLETFVPARDAHGTDEFETFMEVGEDLERRSRRSATMARLLEQHRHQLQTAEKERDDAYEKLSRVYPVVQETTRALKEAMDARKVDEDSSRMQRLFQLNGRALDELEKVSVTLFADFLWCKTAWEQYAKTVEDARQLRSNAET